MSEESMTSTVHIPETVIPPAAADVAVAIGCEEGDSMPSGGIG